MRRRTPEDTDAFTPSRTARTYQHDIAIHGCMHECMPTLIGCTIIVASRGATRELATAQQIDMSKLSCIRTHTHIYIHSRSHARAKARDRTANRYVKAELHTYIYIYIGARWVAGESWTPCIQTPRLKLTRALL